MARIRSIKPEFWVSEQIGECSPNARLTFIGLWNFCDDNGVHPAKPKTLKAELFPMDSFAPAEIEEWVRELTRVGLVGEFEHAGSRYWYVTGWAKHQRIDRPSAKHPRPPGADSTNARGALADESTTTHRELGEDSTNHRRAPPPGVEGSGEENVSEEANASSSSPAATKTPTIPCPYDALVAAYHEELPLWPKVKLRDGPLWNDRQKAMRTLWGWVLSSRRADGSQRAETGDQAIEWFRDYFARALKNDFLMGRIPRDEKHKGWKADFDFLLTKKGMKQVIEKTEAAA